MHAKCCQSKFRAGWIFSPPHLPESTLTPTTRRHLLSDQATSAEAIQDTVEILNGHHEPWWPTEQIYPAILCLPWKDGQVLPHHQSHCIYIYTMNTLIVFFHGTQKPVVCRCFSFSKEYFQVPH